MSKNTTAIQRGAMLAKEKISHGKKIAGEIGVIKIDNPNRAQRRAAKKQKDQDVSGKK